jgi:hypothetical protein
MCRSTGGFTRLLRVHTGLRPTVRDETAGVRRGVPPERPLESARGATAARFLRHFERFQGFADRKISPPPIRWAADFPRTTPRMNARLEPRLACEKVVLSASLERGRIWRDSNSVLFVFNGLQGGKVSLAATPRIRRSDRCVALANSCLQETARGRAASAISDSRPRAFDASAGRRRARHAAAGFWEHGHGGFSSSEGERRE